MKQIFVILLFLSTIGYGQIVSEHNWPVSIQKEFNKLDHGKNDTILVYYSWVGPWSSLPDSCKNISSIWILGSHQNRYLVKQISCLSFSNKGSIEISPIPLKYFASHLNDFRRNKEFLKNLKKFITSSDQNLEYLIFMTSKTRVILNLSMDVINNKEWRKHEWSKSIISAFDTTKYYIYKKNAL
jgi:hypothetical protein